MIEVLVVLQRSKWREDEVKTLTRFTVLKGHNEKSDLCFVTLTPSHSGVKLVS